MKIKVSNGIKLQNKGQVLIFSLGGSLVVPGNMIDVSFLRKFKSFVLSLLKNGNLVVIVVGGGAINRRYISAARKITQISSIDLDWLGIAATKLNAELIRVIFTKKAYKTVLDNPSFEISLRKTKLIIASGWLPGSSSDLDAILWAKRFKSKTVINLTDIDFVCDKDPDKYKLAKPLPQISWNNFIKIVGKKWSPRKSTPFDPIASQLAKRLGMKVIILNGKKLRNLKNYLNGKKFSGTIIE